MNHEFKLLTGNYSSVQKTLNQWRHEYILHIHQMFVVVEHVYVLLERERKMEDPYP